MKYHRKKLDAQNERKATRWMNGDWNGKKSVQKHHHESAALTAQIIST